MRYWRGNQRLKKSQPFGDIDTQSLTLTDYQTSLAKAEQNKNYSLAIRYQFLILLVKLDQREWILKKSWKTNWDYYQELKQDREDRKSTRLNSSHVAISYAVFCLKNKTDIMVRAY